MAILLDGERLSQRMKMEFGDRVARLNAVGRTVGLATVLVGDDGPSAKYVAMKHADCAAIGIESIGRTLPASATQRDVEAVVDELNADPTVHAILVQLPLPSGMNEEEVLLRIDPKKDADGLHPVNLGKMLLGAPGPLPCTPVGIIELLAAYEVPVEGRHVVIVGRGTTIGRPLSVLLSSKRPGCNAAVTQVHTGVANISDYTRQGDVIIAAAGSAGLITPDMVKPGAAVVGAGTSWNGTKLLSDVHEDVADVAGWITPRIGGVGPMTRAMLLKNAVLAGERAQ
jgi:methylenetetrahydrofolate dehydrogenase (NADP+) / methenyltetrahydrofolate cyclohydrolase